MNRRLSLPRVPTHSSMVSRVPQTCALREFVSSIALVDRCGPSELQGLTLHTRDPSLFHTRHWHEACAFYMCVCTILRRIPVPTMASSISKLATTTKLLVLMTRSPLASTAVAV